MRKTLTLLIPLLLSIGLTGLTITPKTVSKSEKQNQNRKQIEISKLEDVIKSKAQSLGTTSKSIEDYALHMKKLHNSKDEKFLQKEKNELASRGEERGRRIDVVATAYIALCDTGCTGRTATGLDVRHTPSKQVVAVDPNVIPLYSKLKIELPSGETFYATALDTGGDIKGARIDILMATYDEAINFGVKNVTVTILSEGE